MKFKTNLYKLIFQECIDSEIPDQHFYDKDVLFGLKTNNVNLGRQSGKTVSMMSAVVNDPENIYMVLTYAHEQNLSYYSQIESVRKATGKLFKAFLSTHTKHGIKSAFEKYKTLATSEKDKQRKLVIFIEEPRNKTSEILCQVKEEVIKLEDLKDYTVIVLGEQ